MNFKIRYQAVTILFLSAIVNYMDRAAFSVTAPLVSHDLHLGAAQLGFVFSSFFVGYAIFALVGGWSADRLGARVVIAASLIAWSIFCGLTAAAVGFGSLLVIRTLFGMSEGPAPPAQNKFIGNWFPRGEQARALGFVLSGAPLGGFIGAPIFGFIAAAYGWRVSFLVAGLIGLALAAVWLRTSTERPEENARLSAAERAERAPRPATSAASSDVVPLRSAIFRPAVLATAFAFFGFAYLLFFFLSWFPSYLTSQQHLSLKGMSLITAIPWGLGFAGNIAGGWIMDAAYLRTGRTLQVRKTLMVTCLMLAAVFVALAGIVHGLDSAVALMAASVFFLYLTGPSYFALVNDIVDRSRVGTVSGVFLFSAACAGIFAPSITGLMIQSAGNFTGAFILAGVVAFLGALGVALAVRAPAAVPDAPRAR